VDISHQFPTGKLGVELHSDEYIILEFLIPIPSQPLGIGPLFI
jgi:hypothetical protein